MKRRLKIIPMILFAVLACVTLFFGIRAAYPRPHLEVVTESGLDPALVYAVVKAESGFDERAVSRAGAVGLMQLRPSTAAFICERDGICFEEDRLCDGAYNLGLGCRYLSYLLTRFPAEETALAAYNAGEGTVRGWLADPTLSPDGTTLTRIPYPETEDYVKKVARFKNFYEFFY